MSRGLFVFLRERQQTHRLIQLCKLFVALFASTGKVLLKLFPVAGIQPSEYVGNTQL
jgi:hypothetical protein